MTLIWVHEMHAWLNVPQLEPCSYFNLLSLAQLMITPTLCTYLLHADLSVAEWTTKTCTVTNKTVYNLTKQ